MMNKPEGGTIFLRGVPVAPDVDRLMTLDIAPGAEFDYALIGSMLGLKPDSSGHWPARFSTVLHAWRKRLLRERNLRVKYEGRKAKIMTASEMHSAHVGDVSRIFRATVRSYTYAEAIDVAQLTADEHARHMLAKRLQGNVLAEMQGVRRAIAAAAPPRAIRKK
jgi:hypothetical protein